MHQYDPLKERIVMDFWSFCEVFRNSWLWLLTRTCQDENAYLFWFVWADNSWLPFVRANVCRPLQVSNDSTSLKSKIWSLDLNKIRKVVNFELSRWRKWDAFAFCHMCWDSGFPVPRSTKKQTNKQNRRKCLLNFDLVFMVWLPTGLRPYNRSNTQLSCNHLSIHFPK